MTRGATFEADDGVAVTYDDIQPESGDGEPIVLVHGFASSRQNNWQDTGWYDRLLDAGRRVIALDNRGHGDSGKPHDPGVYDVATMAGDVRALLDHCDVAAVDYFGYSMGGRIGMKFVHSYPERANAAVFGGVGSSLVVDGPGDREWLAEALITDDVESIDNEVGRNFRLFAEANDADREALAAVIRAHGADDTDYDPETVSLPVLIAAGSEDDIIGDPGELAESFGNGQAVVVEGEDHVSTVPHEAFVGAVMDFFEREGL